MSACETEFSWRCIGQGPAKYISATDSENTLLSWQGQRNIRILGIFQFFVHITKSHVINFQYVITALPCMLLWCL